MKLHLGNGKDYKEGYINIEHPETKGLVKADLFLNLGVDKFEYKDNSIDEILANDLLEHIVDLRFLMNECWRVLKPGGNFYIRVPQFPHRLAVEDPTHVRFFISDTFRWISDYNAQHEHMGWKTWKLVKTEKTEDSLLLNVILSKP